MATQVRAETQIQGVLPVAIGGTGTGTAFTPGSVVFAGASGIYTEDVNLAFDAVTDSLSTVNAILAGFASLAISIPMMPAAADRAAPMIKARAVSQSMARPKITNSTIAR